MSATFDPALLTARDRMRFDLGDTNVGATKAAGADALALPVDDAVYAGVLARRGGDERLACIDLAEALIAKYAQAETKASVDGVESAEWANRLVAWRTLAQRLRGEIAAEAPTVAGRGSFSVVRAHRPGHEPGAEYYAGGRPPLDRDYH
jgi:hypothetical protein